MAGNRRRASAVSSLVAAILRQRAQSATKKSIDSRRRSAASCPAETPCRSATTAASRVSLLGAKPSATRRSPRKSREACVPLRAKARSPGLAATEIKAAMASRHFWFTCSLRANWANRARRAAGQAAATALASKAAN